MSAHPLILIVDDDKLLARTLSDMLERKGYLVNTVHNGQDGFNEAIETQPRLTLLDLQMPDMDGMEVLRRLREDERGRKLEVVFSTNTYAPEVINAALSLDVHDYILKADTSLEQIAELVERYVPLTT